MCVSFAADALAFVESCGSFKGGSWYSRIQLPPQKQVCCPFVKQVAFPAKKEKRVSAKRVVILFRVADNAYVEFYAKFVLIILL